MSKTSQRERSAYELGYSDAKNQYGYRWRRHPHLKKYDQGYRDFYRKRSVKRKGIIQKISNKIAELWSKA